jgi:N-acetylmuramoyl-L-alanine amidase
MVSISHDTNPDRIIIHITNAAMNLLGEEATQGVFTHTVKVWQQDGAGIVEAYVSEWPAHSVEYNENAVTIRFFRDNLTGIRYDYQHREILISKDTGLVMDIHAVSHFAGYAAGRYAITLPVNAEGAIGNGELLVRDDYIESVKVEQDNAGRTRLLIHNLRLLAYTVEETDTDYVIRAHPPRDAHPRVVIIDPGHGGSAPGSTSGGLIEKNINLSIALKLMQLLEQEPTITAFFTRTDDRDVSLYERAAFANANGDIFISIHANALRNNDTSHGIETYYFRNEHDDFRSFTSEQLAMIMQRNLLNATNAFDRGVKSDHLVVLRETTIPAVLCEVGFMTNPAEAALLATDDYQWKIAHGLFFGILEVFSIYMPGR